VSERPGENPAFLFSLAEVRKEIRFPHSNQPPYAWARAGFQCHSNQAAIQQSMKTRIFFSILTFLAGPLFAADSSPKDDVTAAAKKLAKADNYGWKAASEFASFTSTTEGKTDKEGLVWLAVTFGDSTTEAFLKGGKGVVKQPDKDWQTLAELENEQGPIQFLVRRLQTFKVPAEQVQDFATKCKEIKKDGDTYAGELTAEGAKDVLSFGRRRSPDAPEPKNAKASVKFWLKDGELSKYELKLSGTVSFGGDEQDIEGTTTAEIKDVGKTKLELPAAAKKKLS